MCFFSASRSDWNKIKTYQQCDCLFIYLKFNIELNRRSYRRSSSLWTTHTWLLKVNFERVLIVLLSESIRTIWLGYSINYCYYIDDQYLKAYSHNNKISFQWQRRWWGWWQWPLIFFLRLVYSVTFHGNFLLFFVCWVLEYIHQWMRQRRSHPELFLRLSITDSERERKRHYSIWITRTIWWTTI